MTLLVLLAQHLDSGLGPTKLSIFYVWLELFVANTLQKMLGVASQVG
jgi:hypothetical protein